MLTPAFLLSSLAVILTPGPDLMLATRFVLRRGRRHALHAVAGMITAGAVQAFVGFAGLAPLLRYAPGALIGLQVLGALVLGTWGVLILRSAVLSRRQAPGRERPQRTARGGPFLQGFLSTGSNPKVGLFLTAFLPQFVPPGAAPGSTLALLAAVYLGIGMTWLVIWVYLAHVLSRTILGPRGLRYAEFATGVVFLLLALRLALEG
jgi:threonine/homoserine/homoserine lactone efflux protein